MRMAIARVWELRTGNWNGGQTWATRIDNVKGRLERANRKRVHSSETHEKWDSGPATAGVHTGKGKEKWGLETRTGTFKFIRVNMRHIATNVGYMLYFALVLAKGPRSYASTQPKANDRIGMALNNFHVAKTSLLNNWAVHFYNTHFIN